MSRGPTAGASPWTRVIETCATIAAPAAAGFALVSLLTAGGDAARNDLHLLLPESASAGSKVPVRAHFYAGLERPEGPRLYSARVVLELRGAAGVGPTYQRLRAGYRNTLEGELALPRAARGLSRVHARATLGSTEVELERPITITEPGRAPTRAIERPRASRALQAFAQGPLHVLDAAVSSGASPLLEVQVQGGACVPQAACVLWVDTGDPSVSVQAVATGSAKPVRAEPVAGPVAKLEIRTHGPEATLELRALRGVEVVARRSVRLPITLGADALMLDAAWLASGQSPRLHLKLPDGERDGCIVDAFVDGVWAHSESLPDCTLPTALGTSFVGPTVVRLQARRDPFGSDNAAVRTLLVAPERQSEAAALAALARVARSRAPADQLAARVMAVPEPYLAARDAVAGYLLAMLEQSVLELPAPSSSRPRSLEVLAAERARARRFALVMLTLSALSLVIMVMQRGWRATDQASAVLREAGQAPELVARGRSRMQLRVLLSAASLVLAFAAMALYVWVRTAAS